MNYRELFTLFNNLDTSAASRRALPSDITEVGLPLRHLFHFWGTYAYIKLTTKMLLWFSMAVHAQHAKKTSIFYIVACSLVIKWKVWVWSVLIFTISSMVVIVHILEWFITIFLSCIYIHQSTTQISQNTLYHELRLIIIVMISVIEFKN